ncbi:MAG: RagB/SusD family nutrient uptake outer membrane protein [Ferruginibacter sp.]
MNRYIIIAAFLTFFLTVQTSCKKYLERDPYGVLTTESFYKTPDQLLKGLTDAYNPLGFFNFEIPLFALGDIVTDDAEKGGSGIQDQAAIYDLSRFRAVASNDICLVLWRVCYRGIFSCNIIIDKAPTVETADPELVKRVASEAKFLRGLYYFHLATTFGGVPLILSPLAPGELQLKRSSYDETWDQIEKDFSDAAAGLPLKSDYNASDLGRATSGAAYSMLAKALLIRQKFTDAEKALQKVVSSDQYKLIDDFGEVWLKANENGIESIFDIQHKNTNSGWMNDTEGSWIPLFCGGRKNGGYGLDCPTQDLRNEFESGDPRLIYTLTFNGDIFGGNDVIDNSESSAGYQSRKVCLGIDERDNPFYDQGFNIRYLRYADVLLLYAEVLNENDKPAEALLYLNQVRARARASNPIDPRRIYQAVNITVNLPDVTTLDKNQLRSAIWHERRVELGMEYQRRFDLIRQKRFGDVMRAYANTYNTDKGALFKDENSYLCPIPSEELGRSNGLIVQNPGY